MRNGDLGKREVARFSRIPPSGELTEGGECRRTRSCGIAGPLRNGWKHCPWIDGIQLEEGPRATEYEPRKGEIAQIGDRVIESVMTRDEEAVRKQGRHFQVKEPLFEELLSDEPGPGVVLYYGLEDVLADEVCRPFAKKFGHRYVLAEAIREIRSRPFIPVTNAWERGGVGSYPTLRGVLRYDVQGVAPGVFDGNPWVTDPRWQEAYTRKALDLAERSLDKSPGNIWGNTWGLWAGDEIFGSFAIKVVPVDKRYGEINAIDAEIRNEFGFGKYGMPQSHKAPDPFARIAFRRWANARLTQTYARTYPLIKKINPKLVMVAPNCSSRVPAMDFEAMTPYFDLVINQSVSAPKTFAEQLGTGADTKATVDLSECPVWAAVQHLAAPDPEAIREQYSQVFRNGGQGLFIHAPEWMDREFEHLKYSNPERWRALLEIADTVTQMKKVKLPDSDTAMLYASDTYLAYDVPKMDYDDHMQMYSAYATLGPCVGSWFTFVSDRQIDRGVTDLKQYKALYIPLATYQRRSVLDKVDEYVRDGGVVVCTDPTAFTWDINGEPLSSRWEEITGVRIGKPRVDAAFARTVVCEFPRLDTPTTVSFPQPAIELALMDESVKLLALFPDGSPAITVRKHGKGYVIFFAADPFASHDRNRGMIQLVRNIQLAAGAKIGRDIWRFKLPPFKTVYVPDAEAHRCLTNNDVKRDFTLERNRIGSGHNLATGGTYTYDRFPTGVADAAGEGDVPFEIGHLTNRRQAFESRSRRGDRNPPEPEKWIVSWTDGGPASVTVDLKKPYALDRVRLFYSGRLPELNVAGSLDGRHWQTMGSQSAQPPTADVLDITVQLKGRCRFVRIRLGPREDNSTMELCEMELWGDP